MKWVIVQQVFQCEDSMLQTVVAGRSGSQPGSGMVFRGCCSSAVTLLAAFTPLPVLTAPQPFLRGGRHWRARSRWLLIH